MTVLLPEVDHKPGDPPEGRHDGLYEGQNDCVLPGLDHKTGDPPEGRHDGLYEGQYDCGHSQRGVRIVPI
jgi:hypothetical protein